MDRIAEVLINKPSKHLDRTFSYLIPAELGQAGKGWRAAVPFGSHMEEGIILSVREESREKLPYKLLNIHSLLDQGPWFTESMLCTALWISSYYVCTLIDALRLFMIDKKGIRSRRVYQIMWEQIPEDDPVRDVLDDSVPMVLEEDAASLWTAEETALLEREGKMKVREIPRSVHKIPFEKWISTLKNPDEAYRKRYPRRAALWDFIRQNGELRIRDISEAGFSPSMAREICAGGWARLLFKYKDTYSLVEQEEETAPPVLTEEQKNGTERICRAVEKGAYAPFLLYGVTGSGKTEVYLRAAEEAARAGGEVLILVPEIAMTDQIVRYFAARFGDGVVFMHSRLSKGERYNNRMRLERGESRIVIGSRSALFMPFRNLKLIVVDEEYDSSYKQDETPRYNGRDVAKMMAVIYQCPLVLGAATPSVSTYFAAREGQLEILRLSSRVLKTPLPHISAVDMRDEYAVGNRSLFSYPLLNLLKETAERGEKSIVFLNRRGYSTSLICRSCGYVFRCPRCDVALVYHKDRHQLKCHYCESVFPVPAVCPQCGKKDISYAGAGTQKAEEQLEEWLPGISYRRLDLDSVSRKNSGEKILSDFREGRFQILLGTQMVAKGHNIPGVQSVGILSVDNLLGMPTYLAAEQVFTLITQCAGRAGRYGKQGEVILQTFNPEHYAVETARHQDYEAFYSREIQFRRELFYPPFSRMMKISCFGTEYQAVSDHAEKLYRWLRIAAEHQRDFRMTPPYDEPIRKVRDRYYVSILIKAGSLTGLKSAMRESPLFHENGIIIDVDPI